jgi:hypothetical protein
MLRRDSLSLTPGLTRKLHDLSRKALTQCPDYREDLRAGNLRPR